MSVLTVLLRLRVSAEIWLLRHGWAPVLLIALTLCLATYSWNWLLPSLDKQADLRNELEAKLVSRPVDQPKPGKDARREQFNQALAALPPRASAQRLIEDVFATALLEGLRIERSDFQYDVLRDLPCVQVSATLPLEGSYPAARRFITRVMREHPNVSLDQLSIKRDSPHQSSAKLVVVFSGWFKLAPGPQLEDRWAPVGSTRARGARP